MSVSHSMGLTAPGCLEHKLSMHLLSSGSTSAGQHMSTSIFTHQNHVFWCLPFFLVSGSGKFVIYLIQDMARCTCPWEINGHRDCSPWAHGDQNGHNQPWLSRDWAMTWAVIELWPSRDWAVIILKMLTASCDRTVIELWPSRDWAVT